MVLTVLLAWALAALAVPLGLAPAQTPSTRPLPVASEGRVVLIGIPGLTWDLVDDAPTLTAIADTGGSAALVARGGPEVSCAQDAWQTVGSGERAEAMTCAVDALWSADGELAPHLSPLNDLAAAGGTCVSGAALAIPGAAAGPAAGDAVDPARPAAGDAVEDSCRIHLLSAPAVTEGDRTDTLAGIDAAIGALFADLPEDTSVLVSGMGQTAGRADAQVLLLAPVTSPDAAVSAQAGDAANTSGPADTADGVWPAALTSGSTRQASLVQFVDLTPTLLHLADVPVPAPGNTPAGGDGPLAGAPIERGEVVGAGAPADAAAELAGAVSLARALTPWTLGALAVVLLPALTAGLLLRRRSSARGGRGRVGQTLSTASASTIMAVPAATFLAGLAPWWRAGQPWVALTLLILGIALTVALVAGLVARRRPGSPLAGPAVVATVTAIVLGVDVLWSARLGLVSVMGLVPVTAGRFYGQGNVGFGLMLGAVLVLMAAVLAAGHRPRVATAAVTGLGLAAVALGAAPQAGADFGSVPALAVATGLVALAALGRRWSGGSVALIALVASALAVVVMVLDWLRGPDSRTHLGAFVQAIIDGQAWDIVARKLDQSLGILVSYPVSWLAVGVLVGVVWVVAATPAWSAPVWRLPGARAVALASVVAMVLAWALNDSGIAAVAACLTMLIATGVVAAAPAD